ncbi:unnamed protein product [Phytophthora fragariaefolia]|uniref:Unnamed protein product n=1 Tax=Phytophthora fragariaefolia TaxID=1490495 RepID=A0A9W6TQD7_9STRA|nr:unnamed protein product [Phytophthora fragariaefolia]
MTFRSNSYLIKGDSQAECERVIQHWPDTVDYWYPSSRSLTTIDCVALLEINGHDEFGLLQITRSKIHKIDPEYLDKISKWLSPHRPHRYIAVVPNKDICDEFRLDKADPDTVVPLYVAYVDDRFFEQLMNE